MQSHYGYFNRTKGKDGDQIDVFVGDHPESKMVFVVDQNNPQTGEFDESKVMLGYNSIEEAEQAYLENYDKGWKGLGAITPIDIDTFRTWLGDGHRQAKPFSEYVDIQKANVTPNEYAQNPVDYTESNKDYFDEQAKPPMSSDEVHKEYLRADLEREISNADIPPVAENELRSRFGFEKNNGTELTIYQAIAVNAAEFSIRRKLGKKYPELKNNNQQPVDNSINRINFVENNNDGIPEPISQRVNGGWVEST